MVKEELNSEEKFFEKAVMTERFVSKYKKPLIGLVVAVVLATGSSIAYDAYQKNKIESANNFLAKLQKNPQDETSLNELKSLSPNLHDAWVLSESIVKKDLKKLESLSGSHSKLVTDIASYEVAQSSQELSKLNAYALKDGAIYRDLAIVQSAILLMNSGEIKQAHEKLSQIAIDSSLSNVAKALLHYGVK